MKIQYENNNKPGRCKNQRRYNVHLWQRKSHVNKFLKSQEKKKITRSMGIGYYLNGDAIDTISVQPNAGKWQWLVSHYI